MGGKNKGGRETRKPKPAHHTTAKVQRRRQAPLPEPSSHPTAENCLPHRCDRPRDGIPVEEMDDAGVELQPHFDRQHADRRTPIARRRRDHTARENRRRLHRLGRD